MKDFCRQVLRFFPTSRTPRYERIHPVEILFVQLGKVRTLPLRSFDQHPVIRLTLSCLHCALGVSRSDWYMRRRQQKVTGAALLCCEMPERSFPSPTNRRISSCTWAADSR